MREQNNIYTMRKSSSLPKVSKSNFRRLRLALTVFAILGLFSTQRPFIETTLLHTGAPLDSDQCGMWPYFSSSEFLNIRRGGHKYLRLAEWTKGRTNNHIISFRNAARIAKALHRTLIVPHEPFLEYIDLACLAVNGFIVQIDRSQRHTHTEELLRMKNWHRKYRMKIPKVGKGIIDCWSNLRARELRIAADPIFYSCTEDLDQLNLFDKALKPTPHLNAIISEAQKKLNLTKYEYVSIHQRFMEGSCGKRTSFFAKFPTSRTKEACNITKSVVDQRINQAGIRKDIPWVLAQDGQNSYAAQSLIDAGAITVKRVLPKASKLELVLVDIFMLIEGAFMIGNPVSTMSQTVYRLRRARLEMYPHLFEKSLVNRSSRSFPLSVDDVTHLAYPDKLGLEEEDEMRTLNRCVMLGTQCC